MAMIEIGLTLALAMQSAAPDANPATPTLAEQIEAARQADGGDEPPTIIVQAEDDSQKKQIIVGSRIPKKPWLKPGPVATNTGTPGFTPGSGMDPSSRFTRTITTRECRSDLEELSPNACRALATADAALASGDMEEALFWLRSVSSWQSGYAPVERLVGAEKIFAIGRDADDADLRLEALTDMLHTGALPQEKQLSAARSAAAIAMNKGEDDFASLMLQEVIKLDPADSQSIANLAILQRKAQDAAASQTMLRAIAVREQAGRNVPKGWRDFVALPPQ